MVGLEFYIFLETNFETYFENFGFSWELILKQTNSQDDKSKKILNDKAINNRASWVEDLARHVAPLDFYLRRVIRTISSVFISPHRMSCNKFNNPCTK